jgi:hypothetical protein
LLISNLRYLRLIDADVDDPVAGSRVIDIKLVLLGNALFFDKDFLADFHCVEKGPRDCGGYLASRDAELEAVELARLEKADKGSSHDA